MFFSMMVPFTEIEKTVMAYGCLNTLTWIIFIVGNKKEDLDTQSKTFSLLLSLMPPLVEAVDKYFI